LTFLWLKLPIITSTTTLVNKFVYIIKTKKILRKTRKKYVHQRNSLKNRYNY